MFWTRVNEFVSFSTLTGRILDDGATPPPVIELQGISAGQLAAVLAAYTPQTEHTANTAAIGVNAAAIAALQGQVAALPAAPDLAPYALAADLAAAEGYPGQRFRPGGREHEPDPRFGCQSQPERFGCSASRSQRQEHPRFGRPQAGQPSHDGGDEQQHRLHKQRHPGDCCGKLRPEIGGGPVGDRSGGAPNSCRRGPASRHRPAKLRDPGDLRRCVGAQRRPPGRT